MDLFNSQPVCSTRSSHVVNTKVILEQNKYAKNRYQMIESITENIVGKWLSSKGF